MLTQFQNCDIVLDISIRTLVKSLSIFQLLTYRLKLDTVTIICYKPRSALVRDSHGAHYILAKMALPLSIK